MLGMSASVSDRLHELKMLRRPLALQTYRDKVLNNTIIRRRIEQGLIEWVTWERKER